MLLKKGKETTNKPKFIQVCDNSGEWLADVYIDKCFLFNGKKEITYHESSQITIISDNFNLFYDNIN